MSGIKSGTWGTCRANIGGVSSSKIEDCLKDCFFLVWAWCIIIQTGLLNRLPKSSKVHKNKVGIWTR